jgi:hypothetical protein
MLMDINWWGKFAPVIVRLFFWDLHYGPINAPSCPSKIIDADHLLFTYTRGSHVL